MFIRYIALFFLIACIIPIHAADKKNNIADNCNILFGCAENPGKKKRMEDVIIAQNPFGIFDGHSGKDELGELVATTAKQKFESYKKTHPYAQPSSEEIKNLFDQIQDNLPQTKSGSTASLIFCDENQAWCAQLGDSMIIDSNGSIVLPLQTPYNPDEAKRVGEENITKHSDDVWRLHGLLAMTRSFGHQNLVETSNLISEPEVKALPFLENDFFVITSDGVYEEFCLGRNEPPNHAALYIAAYVKQRIGENIDLTRIAKEILLISAYGRYSRDEGIKNIRSISDQVMFDKKWQDEERELQRTFDNQSIIIVQKKAQPNCDNIKTTSTN